MRVMIAGGGTGGHLFPGIALAQELIDRNQGHDVIFVGTPKGLEVKHVPKAGFELALIHVGALRGKGVLGIITSMFRIPKAILQSLKLIRHHRPDVVVGVGGYASGPVVLAAFLRRLPTIVLEQNALPGFTNRILGKLVRKVIVAFPEALGSFAKRKVLLLGNPVRKALVDNFLMSRKPQPGYHLLVFGGSQGARTINRVMPEVMALLAERIKDLRLIHQTGEYEYDLVRERYLKLGLLERVDVRSFIEDMSAAYRQADLVVSRAGATTVTELALCRKPSLLIPYPYAADNHQEVNARSLVLAGAAVMIRESELSAEYLADQIAAILFDAQRRALMEEAASSVSRPEAARDIAEVCLEMVAAKGKGNR